MKKFRIFLFNLIILIIMMSSVAFAGDDSKGHWFNDNGNYWYAYNSETTSVSSYNGAAFIEGKYYMFLNGYLDPDYDIYGYDYQGITNAIIGNQNLERRRARDGGGAGGSGAGAGGGGNNSDTADLMPTMAFNNQEVFGDTIGANGTQFPLYGVFVNQGVTQTRGNREFMSKSDLTNNFGLLLHTLEYNEANYQKWLEKLKKLYEIGSSYFGANVRTILDVDVLNAKAQTDTKTTKRIWTDIFNVLLKIIGALFIAYALVIIIFGVLDENGVVGDSLLLEKATKGALSADKGGPYFRVKYLLLGLCIAFLGVVIFSGTIVTIAQIVLAFFKKIINFFTSSSLL